jgi:hypothetical protein
MDKTQYKYCSMTTLEKLGYNMVGTRQSYN